MPSSKSRVTDIVCRLGLLAPYTRLATDWALQPAVRSLYVDGLNGISKQYCNSSNPDIRASHELRNEVERLLHQYGPIIWSRSNGARPWLFDVKDSRTQGLYTHDLFYDYDIQILGDSLYELAVEKAVRYRKENIRLSGGQRLSSVTSDPSWTPDETQSTRATPGRIDIRCFAPALSEHDHHDASWLKANGVWLGDYNEDNNIVTELSFRDVMREHYSCTNGGQRKNTVKELYTNSGHALEMDKAMVCAACRSAGRPYGLGMVAEHAEFTHLDMSRTVWIYACKLEERKVFAILKSEKVKLDHSAYLWSFWKTTGGYTKDMFLTAAPKQQSSASVSKVASRQPGRHSQSAIERDNRLRDSTGDEERIQYDHDTGLIPSRVDEARRRSFGPLKRSPPDGDETLPVRQRQRTEFDEAYDVTPGVQTMSAALIAKEGAEANRERSKPHDTRFFRKFVAPQVIDEATPEPARLSPENAQAGRGDSQSRSSVSRVKPSVDGHLISNSTKRMRVWLRLRNAAGRTVALLDEDMTVQSVFDIVEQKLSWKLKGEPIQALSFVASDHVADEDPIDIGLNDQETWEALLALLKAPLEEHIVELNAVVEV